MNNGLMVFEGQEVEVFEFDGNVLFNPKHVGACLDMSDVTVRRHLQDMNENKKIKLTNSGVHSMNIRKLNNAGEVFITESGVYDLIFKSRKPSAIAFKDWVTDEVLPQIRKTGGYIPVDSNDTEAEIMAKALLIAQQTLQKKDELLKQKDKELELQKPKVETYDRFIDKEHTLGFRELRKQIESSLGIKINENELKEVMREYNLIGKTVKATAFAIREGYAVTKDIETDFGTKTQDRFTMKTRDLLYDLFS